MGYKVNSNYLHTWKGEQKHCTDPKICRVYNRKSIINYLQFLKQGENSETRGSVCIEVVRTDLVDQTEL